MNKIEITVCSRQKTLTKNNDVSLEDMAKSYSTRFLIPFFPEYCAKVHDGLRQVSYKLTSLQEHEPEALRSFMAMQVCEMLQLILCYHLTHSTKCICWLASLFLSMVPPFFQPPRLELLELVFILLASQPLTQSLTKFIQCFYVSFPSKPISLVPLQDLNSNSYYFMPVQLQYSYNWTLFPSNWPCVPPLD